MRVRELDGLRGIAVLAVMAHHYRLPGAELGWLGVDLFFVLSGYLITNIVTAEGFGFRRFYRRRTVRLFPAFAVVLAALAVSVPLVSIAAAGTYVINWTMAFGILPVEPALGHTWSLAVEWQFYLVWPAVVIFWPWSRLALARLALVLAVLSAAWMLYLSSDWMRAFTGTDSHAWGVLLGSALALLNVSPPSSRALRFRPLVWVGVISYGLYLWHVPVIHGLGGNAAASIVVTFAIAAASFRYLERPLLRRERTNPPVRTVAGNDVEHGLRRDRAVGERAVDVEVAGGTRLDPVDLKGDVA